MPPEEVFLASNCRFHSHEFSIIFRTICSLIHLHHGTHVCDGPIKDGLAHLSPFSLAKEFSAK